MSITSQPFGETAEGTPIERYTLTNAHGLEAEIMTYGGTLIALRVPDRTGAFGDVVLGFDTLTPYLGEQPFLGALVGRFCNRIAGAQFTLNGTTYQLAHNDGANHLHGGPHGFHHAIWRASERPSSEGPSLELHYLSRDGEAGYPGNLSVTVTYTLTDQNALWLDYSATTDRDTVINLTNHAYFNLTGGDILSHELQLDATQISTDRRNFDPNRRTSAGTRYADGLSNINRNWRTNQRRRRAGAPWPGLRSYLGARQAGWCAWPCGARVCAGKRAGAGCCHHCARHPVLLRQYARWQPGRQRWNDLFAQQRPMPGNAALPRFAQPAAIPINRASPWRNLSPYDDLSV